MANHGDEQQPDIVRRVGSLEYWRTTKVDPMIDNHQRILIEGDGPNSPSLITFVALISNKFDMVLEVVHGAAKFIKWSLAVIIMLITIWGFFGPLIRQFLHLPIAISLPSEPKKDVKSPQDAGAINEHHY